MASRRAAPRALSPVLARPTPSSAAGDGSGFPTPMAGRPPSGATLEQLG